MPERFLTQAQAEWLKARASTWHYHGVFARRWNQAYEQAIAEAAVRPGDADESINAHDALERWWKDPKAKAQNRTYSHHTFDDGQHYICLRWMDSREMWHENDEFGPTFSEAAGAALDAWAKEAK
jgi:hypothetical protein